MLKFLEVKDLPNLPKPEFMVQGMFRTKGVHYIIAPPKSGKTFFTVDLIARISLGWNTLWDTKTKRSEILYIAAEDIENVAERILAWMFHHDVKDLPSIHIYPQPLHLVHQMKELIESLKMLYPDVGLVVFDTQSACTRGINENTKNEWDSVFSNIGVLCREFDCAVWLIHHEGVSGRMRGTTDMEAEAITVVSLNKTNEQFTIKCKYARGVPFGDIELRIAGQRMGYVDNFGNDAYVGVMIRPDGLANTGNPDISSLLPSQEKILMILGNQQLLNKDLTYLCMQEGMKQRTVALNLKKLVDMGIIVRTPSGIYQRYIPVGILTPGEQTLKVEQEVF